MMNSAVRAALSSFADSPALLSQDGQVISFARMQSGVRALTDRLAALGIGPGDTVAPVVDNVALRVLLWFAVWRRGATLVLSERPAELEAAGQKVDHVVTMPGQVVKTAGRVHVLTQDWLEPGDAKTELPDLPDGQLIYGSSGSTGVPKYMQTGADSIAASANMLIAARPDLSLPALVTFPTVTHTALVSILVCLFQGQGVCFPMGAVTETLKAARSFGARAFGGPPQNLRDIVEVAEDGGEVPAFTSISYGGAIAERDLLHRTFKAYGAPVKVFAGTSECGTFAMGAYAGQEVPDGWSGNILPFVEYRLLQVDDEITDLPEGAGRLAVRVPENQRLIGYLGQGPIYDPDGWFETGDVVTISGEGELCFVGRQDFLINLGGTKYAPERIEAFVNASPGVHTCAAVPVRQSGSTGLALYVVASEGFDAEVLKSRLQQENVPLEKTAIVIVDALPELPSGKLDRATLQSLYAARPST